MTTTHSRPRSHRSGSPAWRRLAVVAALVTTTAAVGAGPAGARDATSRAPRNEMHVSAVRHGFRIAGELTEGPATIHFANGDRSPHALDLYRLSPGVTLERFMHDATSGDWDAFAADLADGGPGNGTPDIVGPGRSATVTGDGLRPGTYAVIDGTPGTNGVPNWLQGFATSLTVAGTDRRIAPPESDGTITVTDTAVHLPPAITTGRGTFAVHYDGDHELQLLRMRPGATVRQAFDYWMAVFGGQAPTGPPPAELVGGLADLRPGVHGWVTLDLPPGTYGVWSIVDGDFTDVYNGVTATFEVHG